MRIFGTGSPSAREKPPSVKSVPRRYRRALRGAAVRSLSAINTAARQGRPVQQASLHERARAADKFWRFLESELPNQGLGSMQRIRADPRLRAGAQEVHDWFARQCGIRPSTVVCIAWADQFNKEAEAAYAREHPGEPVSKRWTDGPTHFAAVADDASGGPCVDGVLKVMGDSFKLTVSGASSAVVFTAEAVREVREEADGCRLEIGAVCPYSSVLMLASGPALSAALRRAGLRP